MSSSKISFNTPNNGGSRDKNVFEFLQLEFNKINDKMKTYHEQSFNEIRKLSSEINDLKNEVETLKEKNDLLIEVVNSINQSQKSTVDNKFLRFFTEADKDKIIKSLKHPMILSTIFNEINSQIPNFTKFR
jgi:cell fate (sporulation/competence/biofilm development) regulator YlbF (YheA/YmcA/DUF963 family)